MSLNTVSPTTFTTAVLVGDSVSDDQLPLMTEVGNVPVAAALEIQSTAGSLLVPRMTTEQRDVLAPVTNGMMIYNTETNTFDVYQDGQWKTLSTV